MEPIVATADLEALCTRLSLEPFIAVDTEFMRETTYWPRLCLIQVAGPDESAVIDPMAEGLDLSPLLKLLGDETLMKVFHAGRQDIEIFNNLGVIPRPVFDTQIAAMAAGYGEQIAYDALVRQMLRVDLDKSSRFTDWARRPLSAAQLTYAAADVIHLATLYPKLRERLEKNGRLAWVSDEMASLLDPSNYDVDPENAWKRLKPRRFTAKYLSVFRAVAAWRERTAQTRDQVRSRILKDEAIDEIAAQAPTSTDAFERLRSVPKGFGNSKFGPELAAVVKQAVSEADTYAPTVERPERQAPAPGAVVELLKVLLKSKAEEANVAPRLIATVGDLEKIAVNDRADTPALKGWRRQLFGEDALKLKRGELALVLEGARVQVVEIEA
ncbi:MAG TPA: ribonuclease D [Caulobacteraceae bacterium]|jgi:ribonuclease D